MCLALALALVAAGLVVVGVLRGVTATPPVPPPEPVVLDHAGAVALAAGYVDRSAPATPLIPPIDRVRADWVGYAGRCFAPRPDSVLRRCPWIAPAAPGAPVIVVVGDSHMQQFLPAVGPIARENGWGVDAIIRGACPFSVASETVPGSTECTAWNREAIADIIATRPNLVVASASRNVRVGLTESTPPGFVAAWGLLADHGIPVLAVRDNPRYDHSPTACVVAKGPGAIACEVPRDAIYPKIPPILTMAIPPTVHYLDTADLICGVTSCAPENGNVLLYMDDNHMTATYTASMAPAVGPHVAEALRR